MYTNFIFIMSVNIASKQIDLVTWCTFIAIYLEILQKVWPRIDIYAGAVSSNPSIHQRIVLIDGPSMEICSFIGNPDLQTNLCGMVLVVQ